jgi:glycosyltransferase involved in cell wall biosynthesis
MPKRVLILSGFRIFPNSTGGHLRTGNIARAFARMGHQVTLYSMAGRNADYRSPTRSAGFLREDIEANLAEHTNLGIVIGILQAVGRRMKLPRVWQYALLRMGLVPGTLRQAIAESDVIFSDLPWCPPLARARRGQGWYLISHNLEFRLLQQGTFVDRCASGWMRSVERRAPRTYDDVFACAEEDQQFFRENDASRSRALPIVRNGIDPSAYRFTGEMRSTVRSDLGFVETDTLLLFSGSNFGPNTDALQVLQTFNRRHASWLAARHVYILAVGSMSRRHSREGALITTGRVPEVLPYFAAADAGLNPVTRGSGSNLKLFEYVAAGLPVLSTAFGARGTTLVPGLDYLEWEGEALLEAIDHFLARPREEWRGNAARVWQTQREEFDMEVIVRGAVRKIPALARLLG